MKENKLEFEHKKNYAWEEWRLTYYVVRNRFGDECRLIIKKEILCDSKKYIYSISPYCCEHSLMSDKMFIFSDLESAKRSAIFIAKCHIAGRIDFIKLNFYINEKDKKKDFDSFMTALEKELKEYEDIHKKP